MILLLITGRLAAQDTLLRSFLAQNKATVTTSTIDNILFDSAFYSNQYFLFGENHGSSQPQQYDLALLQLLHRKAGIRYYLAEVEAWFPYRCLP